MECFIIERTSDRKILDREFPLDPGGAGRRLSGAGKLSGKVLPVPDLPEIVPWQTLIHREVDGIIRGSFIVTRWAEDGPNYTLEAHGFSSYVKGRLYTKDYRWVDADPIQIVKDLWAHAQGKPGGNLHVVVKGSSAARLGTDSDIIADEKKAERDERKKAYDALVKPRKDLQAKVKERSKPHDKILAVLRRDRRILVDSLADAVAEKLSSETIAARKALVTAKSEQITERTALKNAAVKTLKDQIQDLEIIENDSPLKAAYDAAVKDYNDAKEQVSKDGGSWRLSWWDHPDIGSQIEELAGIANREFVEWSSWNADRTRIDKEIRFSARVGAARKMEFASDTNIVDQVEVVADGTDYANVIVAQGAGEGEKALRVTLPASDGRLYRERVLELKNVTKKDTLEVKARAELKKAQRGVLIEAIEVIDHEAARFGTYGIGDTVPVVVETERHGRISQRSRILEIEEQGDTARLILEAV